MSEEKVPVGLVTMLLTGYTNTIHKLTVALVIVSILWFSTVLGFLIFLAHYEVEVVSCGQVEDSHINASTGQQADNLNNNYYGGNSLNESNQ